MIVHIVCFAYYYYCWSHRTYSFPIYWKRHQKLLLYVRRPKSPASAIKYEINIVCHAICHDRTGEQQNLLQPHTHTYVWFGAKIEPKKKERKKMIIKSYNQIWRLGRPKQYLYEKSIYDKSKGTGKQRKIIVTTDWRKKRNRKRWRKQQKQKLYYKTRFLLCIYYWNITQATFEYNNFYLFILFCLFFVYYRIRDADESRHKHRAARE